MIKIFCDRCGNDCDKCAFDVRVSLIQNPIPLYTFDKGDPKLTNDHSQYRFILCQKCSHEMGFPNIFKVQETGKLKFSGVGNESTY